LITPFGFSHFSIPNSIFSLLSTLYYLFFAISYSHQLACFRLLHFFSLVQPTIPPLFFLLLIFVITALFNPKQSSLNRVLLTPNFFPVLSIIFSYLNVLSFWCLHFFFNLLLPHLSCCFYFFSRFYFSISLLFYFPYYFLTLLVCFLSLFLIVFIQSLFLPSTLQLGVEIFNKISTS